MGIDTGKGGGRYSPCLQFGQVSLRRPSQAIPEKTTQQKRTSTGSAERNPVAKSCIFWHLKVDTTCAFRRTAHALSRLPQMSRVKASNSSRKYWEPTVAEELPQLPQGGPGRLSPTRSPEITRQTHRASYDKVSTCRKHHPRRFRPQQPFGDGFHEG